ncbi:MAG: SAM-dependent methyltransferase [Pseudonocardiaceae bacterium]
MKGHPRGWLQPRVTSEYSVERSAHNGPFSASGSRSSPLIDASGSHSARVWNYWLGGKGNYPVDHEVGDQIATVLPSVVNLACASRAFLVAWSDTSSVGSASVSPRRISCVS